MDLSHIQDVYVNNIDRMFEPDNFEHIANHLNEIQGYSFMNRMLIYMQNRFSTKVKSSQSWISDGYIVKDGAAPLGIVSPVTETKYYNSEDGAEVGIKELNPSEFTKALHLGIINKEVGVKELKCTLVFDINDVSKIDEAEDVAKTRKLKLSALYKELSSLGINIYKTENNDTTFEDGSNTLLIGNDNVQSKIECCIDALVKNILNSVDESIELDKEDFRLIRDYSVYAVLTYFNIENSITFEYIAGIYERCKENEGKLDTLIGLLDEIENILNTIIFNANGENSLQSEENKTSIMNRAATLLNILEASYEAFRIKGV